MKSLFALVLLEVSCLFLHAETTLVITADSTLKPVIPELTQAWADNQSDMRVELQFTNSDILMKQLSQDKAGDVVIFADSNDAKFAAKKGLVSADTCKVVARNELVVYGKKPLLADEELEWFDLVAREWDHFALGDPVRTASGRAAQAALQKRDLSAKLKSDAALLAGNELTAIDFVRRTEADAVFALRTDLAKFTVDGFVLYKIDPADYPAFVYTAAPTKNPRTQAAARSFIQSLTGKDARLIWEKYGYGAP